MNSTDSLAKSKDRFPIRGRTTAPSRVRGLHYEAEFTSMTEREMEDLLWAHSEKFFKEPLKSFKRQAASRVVGRADLMFKDADNRILIVELKKGFLNRGAIAQLQ